MCANKFQGSPVNICPRKISLKVQNIEKKAILTIKLVDLNLQFKKVINPIKKANKLENSKRQIGIIYMNIPSRIKNELNIQYNPKIKKESPKNQPTKKASFLDLAL